MHSMVHKGLLMMLLLNICTISKAVLTRLLLISFHNNQWYIVIWRYHRMHGCLLAC